MSSDTNPTHQTAIYAATQQANSFSSSLTTLTLISGSALIVWMLAHAHLGAPPVWIGLARLTMFLAGLWFIFRALTALINHTILTGYRVGVETLAITTAAFLQTMQQPAPQADDANDDDAATGDVEPRASSPITYLQDVIRARALQDAPEKDA